MLVELGLVEQRYRTVLDVLGDGASVTAGARRFGLARQTVHRWLRKRVRLPRLTSRRPLSRLLEAAVEAVEPSTELDLPRRLRSEPVSFCQRLGQSSLNAKPQDHDREVDHKQHRKNGKRPPEPQQLTREPENWHRGYRDDRHRHHLGPQLHDPRGLPPRKTPAVGLVQLRAAVNAMLSGVH